MTIGAIVIAKNEADMIANCIETLRWCDEVVVIDNGSEDKTVEIAERLGAKVFQFRGNFADLRNEGLKRCKSDWLFYVDADERVTPALAKDIKKVALDDVQTSFSVKRSNILYGHVFEHGGWDADWVFRLFKREALKEWAGEVHEHAVAEGATGQLKSLLVHLTHRDVVSSLLKTANWTPIEAKLLYQAPVPKIKLRTILRKTLMEIFRRAILKGGYRDGLAGWVEALTQGMNRMLVYMQVWELQQRPPLPERYQRYEESIAELWKHES